MLDRTIIFVTLMVTSVIRISDSSTIYEILKMGECSDPVLRDSNEIFRNMKYVTVNKTTKLGSLDMILKEPMGDNYEGKIEMKKSSGDGWIAIPFLPYMKDPCSLFLKSFKSEWVKFTSTLGIPHPDKCPIPAGNYTNIRQYTNGKMVSDMPLPVTGKLMVMTLMRNIKTKKVVSCSELIMSKV